MDAYKICPQCRAEYQTRALSCADCQVALVWPADQPEPVAVSEVGWDRFGPDEVLGQLADDSQPVIESYLGHLRNAGIAAAILPQTAYQSRETRMMYSPVFGTALLGGKPGQIPVGDVANGFAYLLFVRRHDYDPAHEILREVCAERDPDLADGGVHEFELGACPACGASVAEDAAACPDCGLTLG